MPMVSRCFRLYAAGLMVMVAAASSAAQNLAVTARVAMAGSKAARKSEAGNVVFWLVPVGSGGAPAPLPSVHPRLVQRNKSFEPHLLVVPVGSVVEFPNRDPFFHNVFSLFEGKRFDLGLYEAGTTRDVVFDKPGISYIFCNIHAEMSAVVVSLATPYYGVSDAKGQLVIPDVPPGRYMLHIWYEQALPEQLNSMTREVVVSENSSTLGLVRLAVARQPGPHKNKYGQDYPPPTPDNPAYGHP